MTLLEFLKNQPRGYQSKLAEHLEITPAMVFFIKTNARKCPLEIAKKIEKFTKGAVTRKDLLPEFFN